MLWSVQELLDDRLLARSSSNPKIKGHASHLALRRGLAHAVLNIRRFAPEKRNILHIGDTPAHHRHVCITDASIYSPPIISRRNTPDENFAQHFRAEHIYQGTGLSRPRYSPRPRHRRAW